MQHGINAMITVGNMSISNIDALTAWRTKSELGRDLGYHFVDGCGHTGDTPCNQGKGCAPFS
jgi:hypothetical protein